MQLSYFIASNGIIYETWTPIVPAREIGHHTYLVSLQPLKVWGSAHMGYMMDLWYPHQALE